MRYNSQNKTKQQRAPVLKLARVSKSFDTHDMFKHVGVIVGSDEEIFEETYMTCVVDNNRVVKFKKSVLEYV